MPALRLVWRLLFSNLGGWHVGYVDVELIVYLTTKQLPSGARSVYFYPKKTAYHVYLLFVVCWLDPPWGLNVNPFPRFPLAVLKLLAASISAISIIPCQYWEKKTTPLHHLQLFFGWDSEIVNHKAIARDLKKKKPFHMGCVLYWISLVAPNVSPKLFPSKKTIMGNTDIAHSI